MPPASPVTLIFAALVVLLSAALAMVTAVAVWNRRRARDAEDALAALEQARPALAAPAAAITAELARAAELQRRMASHDLLRAPGVAITGHAQMVGACGGDWFVCRVLPDGRALIAAGDATGHGLPAAMLAAVARGCVEGVAATLGALASPRRVIEELGALLPRFGDGGHLMTCCALTLDPATGALLVASAGHPFPRIRRAGGALEVVAARGEPLGRPSPSIGIGAARLEPGDVVVIVSDGLLDRAGAVGERRVRQLLAGHDPEPRTGVRQLRADIMAALRDVPAVAPDDDATLVVCEYRERTSGVLAAMDLADTTPMVALRS